MNPRRIFTLFVVAATFAGSAAADNREVAQVNTETLIMLNHAFGGVSDACKNGGGKPMTRSFDVDTWREPAQRNFVFKNFKRVNAGPAALAMLCSMGRGDINLRQVSLWIRNGNSVCRQGDGQPMMCEPAIGMKDSKAQSATMEEILALNFYAHVMDDVCTKRQGEAILGLGGDIVKFRRVAPNLNEFLQSVGATPAAIVTVCEEKTAPVLGAVWLDGGNVCMHRGGKTLPCKSVAKAGREVE